MHKSPAALQMLGLCRSVTASSTKRLARLSLSAVVLFTSWTVLVVPRLSAQDATPAPTAPSQSFELSDEIVRDVLTSFQRAVETRNIDLLLSLFDQSATPNYPQIRDQFVAFFRLHDSAKFRYQLLQVTSEKDIAFATADVEMDALPADDLPTEQRRTAQMRFQMRLTPKGWRLIGLKPMDFFNQ